MKKNVLVFPCGSEIGLEIHNALKYVKNVKLFGASSVADHGKFVYRNYIEGLPNISEDNFIEELNNIVSEYKIDYIFPAHDSAVLKLAQHSENIHAEVMTSAKETCEICRSKKKTYEYFAEEDFIAHMYTNPDEVTEFPVFLKPDVGQGSKGIALAKDRTELEFILSKSEGLLTLEYLPGKEYTIDCFTDRKGELRFLGMRERIRVKSGISVNSVNSKYNEPVKKIAEKINEKLKFQGVWFFQVKEDINGEFKLLEIAPRIAGTMSLYRNVGINFPQLSILDRMGFDLDIIENDFTIEIDRALINRFKLDIEYERVYVDFDDTVTLEEKVNPLTMMFLYQCLSNDKELILITKHEKVILETLKSLKIDPNMFSEIVQIKKDDEKYKYLKNDVPSIFIDDSFVERKKIKDNANIPVFDLDSIESLIDWRY
ncbi:ATP-grasp domain-containing protein [Bacillus suaedaesalsae]|uniref:ATP-grasp domain-containing protein n=1 Tax=Bacillus suaedaesalsae TaxID=2810349 RepID=A0ABS2DKS7_9BACI|nr:ATP-grasp domain-containing protein [Bacillus suaedaesalsae]MBM6619090.1 ATP-grasp domain-containing protein [Bacillus suaedaesalsae]